MDCRPPDFQFADAKAFKLPWLRTLFVLAFLGHHLLRFVDIRSLETGKAVLYSVKRYLFFQSCILQWIMIYLSLLVTEKVSDDSHNALFNQRIGAVLSSIQKSEFRLLLAHRSSSVQMLLGSEN